jgi:hypothetical protein
VSGPTFTSPPKMSLLDRQIADAKARMTAAPTEDLKRYYADRVVGLRFERGDFEMIDKLTDTIRRALVNALLKEAA